MAKRHLLREVQHYSVSKRKRIVRRDSASAGSTEDNVKFENPLHGEDLVSKLLYVTPLRCTCTPSSLRPGSLAYMYAPDVKCVRACYVYAIFAHGYEHAQQVEDARGIDMHTLTVPVDVITRQGPLPQWKSKVKQRCSLLNSRIHVLHNYARLTSASTPLRATQSFISNMGDWIRTIAKKRGG